MTPITWPETLGHPALDALRAIEAAAQACRDIEEAHKVVSRGVILAREVGSLVTLQDYAVWLRGDVLVFNARRQDYLRLQDALILGSIAKIREIGFRGSDTPRLVCEMTLDTSIGMKPQAAESKSSEADLAINETGALTTIKPHLVPVGQIVAAAGFKAEIFYDD